MMSLDKKRLAALATVALTIALSLLFVSIPTDTLLQLIGTENAYVFMYVIAFVGSITTFASIPYPLILIGLASGGLDPTLIGLVSALGVTSADTFTFFAVKRGSILLSDSFQESLMKLREYIKTYPKLLAPGLTLYGTLSPLSNDFAVIGLSLMRYSFWRVIPALAVGNIIYNLALAHLGVYAYDWVVGLF